MSYLTDYNHEDSLSITTSPTAAHITERERMQAKIDAAYAAKKAAQAQMDSDYEKATQGYHPEAGPEPACGGTILARHSDGRTVRDLGNGLLAVDHLGGGTTRLVKNN